MDKVHNFLKELDEDHRHQEIFKFMVFPDTDGMKDKREHAVLQTEYTCTSAGCDFSQCLQRISTNERLKLKWKTGGVCEDIIRDIDQHQDDYLPSQIDGFVINTMGKELVHVKRANSDGKSITGLIEYNDLRKDSMEYYNNKKLEVIDSALRQAATTFKAPIGQEKSLCMIM